MDYPLGGHLGVICKCKVRVLIPILMDYPLGVIKIENLKYEQRSLNPYSNGLPVLGCYKVQIWEKF